MAQSQEVAHKLISIKEKMNTDRSNFETVWQQISEFVLPNRGDFLYKRAKGARMDQRVFDTTAVQANEMLAAAIHGGLINPASNWFGLSSPNPQVKNNIFVRRYLDNVQRVMMKTFNSEAANFYQQAHEFLLDLVAYGTAVMYVDEETGEGIRFITRHLSEIHIQENSKGVADTVVRSFKFSARQAAQEFGEEDLGQSVKMALASDPHKEFEFFHIVMPRKDAERMHPEALEGIAKNRKFVAFYVCEEDKCIVSSSGFYENPYIITRWEKLVGEVYGRSPAWNALSDIRMINVMSEVMIRAAQKQVDPPLLVADDGVIMPLHTTPSGINVGGISMDGRPLIQPLQTGGRLDIGFEMMQQRREAIRQAYFVDQFIPKEGTPVTATEALQNQENRLRLTGPQLARVQTEWLARAIDRVFAIHQRAGDFGEAPEELDGLDLDIEYTSPLAKTQRSQELLSMGRAIQSAGPLIEFDPTLLELIDSASWLRDALDVSGVAARHVRSEKEYQEIKQAQQEQQAQMQQAQMAQEASGAVANLAKAGVEL